MGSFQFILSLLLQCLVIVVAFNGRCPRSWTLFNNTCYRFYDSVKNFGRAQSSCEDLGASLVSISNAQENDFVTKELGLLQSQRTHFWIGLNDIFEEGVFQWTDGTQFRYTFDDLDNDIDGSGWNSCKPGTNRGRYEYCRHAELDYSNWAHDQPSNAGRNGLDCVYVWRSGAWRSSMCSTRRYYVCEKGAKTEGTINETTIRCPHSFETVVELGTSSKVVNWTEPFYWQGERGIAVNRSHSSGDRFPVGVTWVNNTLYDEHNTGEVSCIFSITVLEIDTIRPKVIQCPTDMTVTKIHGLPLTVKWPPPMATDLAKITTTSNYSPGDKFNEGVYRVIYKFIDESRNKEHCSFKIHVIEVNSGIVKDDNQMVYGLVAGLCVLASFIGVTLVLHLVLKLGTKNKDNSDGGKQTYTKMTHGDGNVELI